jgi:HAD superfamily hydrolase (TIGR01490 family)
MRLALFDFDRTLCRVNSWHVFLRWLLRERRPASLKLGLALAVRRVRLISSESLKDIALALFRDGSRDELEALGRQNYGNHLRPEVVLVALAALRRHRTDGFRVVVISVAFNFLLEPFCQEHGLVDRVGTGLARDGDRCLGRLGGPEMRAEEKVKFLRRHFAATPVDWSTSVAYSDELTDLPMLQCVGNGFVVGGRIPRSAAPPAGLKWGSW